MIIKGVGIGRGVAVGPVIRMAQPLPEPSDAPRAEGIAAESEIARVEKSLALVNADLNRRAEEAANGDEGAKQAAPILQAIAMFASDLDAASKAQLNRGSHLTELLKQPQFSPYSMEQEVVSVWAGTHGKMDDLPISDVLPFEKGMLDYLDHNTDILKTIRETEDFTADTEAALDKAVEAFRETFVTSAGKPLVEKKPNVKNATPVEQEKIVAGEK